MNISEVVSRIQAEKSNDAVFRKNLVHNIQSVESTTARIFYGCAPWGEGIADFSDWDKDRFTEFAVRYTCHLLSNFPLRGMSASVKDCSHDSITNWLAAKNADGTSCYNGLFAKIAIDGYYRLGIKDFVRNKAEFEKQVTIKPFFLTHIKDPGNVWVLQALLLLGSANGKDSSDRILEKWREYDGQSVASRHLDQLLGKDWIDAFVHELPNGKGIFNSLYPAVAAACNRERRETKTISGGSFAGGHPVEYSERREFVYYGEDVGAWLRSVGGQYNHFAREPAYMGTEPPDSGCVREGTRILMFSGPAVRIEEIGLHDAVLNCRQSASYATREPVKRFRVNRIYAVNGDAPFMSLDHPILTKRGWCAPNPEISMEMTPEFEVLKLEKGDVFTKAERLDNGAVLFTEITVERIDIAEYPEGVACYDLDFYDGYRSYYANGYPCLCNYPRVTLASLKDRMAALNREERERLLHFFSEHHVTMRKLIGQAAMDVFDEGLLAEYPTALSKDGEK